MLTTPPPLRDPTKDFPELVLQAKTTVILHPRCARDPADDASKMGGTFLWPRDEPWPAHDEAWVDRFVQELLGERMDDIAEGGDRIPEGTSIPFAPILQLRADDFPEMPFPAGTDLFQLLWFPYLCGESRRMNYPNSSIDHRVFWRQAGSIGDRRVANPEMVENYQGFFAMASRLDPERVVEYPNSQDLDPKLERRIDRWKAAKKIEHDGDSPIDYYDWECSTCPSTKVGGHVFWVQDKHVPACSCGRAMTHLLSVSGFEWDGGTERRWRPIEERDDWGSNKDGLPPTLGSNEDGLPPELGNFGHFYLFACLHCDGFPTKAVTSR